MWVYFWALCSVQLIHLSIFVPMPHCFDYCSFAGLSETWKGPVSYFVLFFPRTALEILSLLWFHINLNFICSSYVKNLMDIFTHIALNLQIALSSMAILTILILPIQEHGDIFPFLWVMAQFSLFMFFSSQYKSFTSLVWFVPKLLLLFWCDSKRGCLHFLSDMSLLV